jgi:hypothetical protein
VSARGAFRCCFPSRAQKKPRALVL